MAISLQNLIEQSSKSCLVTGPPGSGKTRLLLDIYIQQITANSYAPDEVWFISCKPAQLSWLKDAIGKTEQVSNSLARLQIKTFWDIALEIIVKNSVQAKVSPPCLPSHRYRYSRNIIIRNLLKKMTLPDKYEQCKDNARFIENVSETVAWIDNVSFPHEMLASLKELRWLYILFSAYTKICVKKGIYFRENMLTVAAGLLRDIVPDKLSVPSVSLMLIDDCQNLNFAQYELLVSLYNLLTSRHYTPKIIFSGNPLFALNAFGGCSTCFLEKAKYDFNIPYYYHVEMKCSQNIAPRILRAVAELDGSAYKSCSAHGNGGDLFDDDCGRVRCVQVNTALDEAYYIAHAIKLKLKEGTAPSDIGILLAGIDDDGNFIGSVLNSMNIPSRIEKGIRLENTFAGNLFCTAMALVDNTADDLLARQFIQSPVFGLSALEVNKIAEYSQNSGLPLFPGAIRHADTISDSKRRSLLLETLFVIRSAVSESTLIVDFLRLISVRSGFYSFIKDKEDVQKDALRKIFEAAQYFSEMYETLYKGEKYTLALGRNDQDMMFPKYIPPSETTCAGCVKIVSLYNCDSYKFDSVFIPGVDATRFPDLAETPIPVFLKQYERQFAKLYMIRQYDRDLLVNAMTRASKEVVLIYPQEAGEPSVWFNRIKEVEGVDYVSAGRVFEVYDNPAQIYTPADARIWARLTAGKLAQSERDLFLDDISGLFPSSSIATACYTDSGAQRVELSPDFSFSPSLLESYLNCPRKFFIERLLNIQSFENIENMLFGNLIHSVLELYHSMYPDWTQATLQQFERAGESLNNILLRQLDKIKGISPLMRKIIYFQAHTCLTNYINELRHERTRIIHVEKKLRFYLESTTFSIKIDRVDTGPLNNGYRIVDYKTTTSKIRGGRSLKNDFLPDGRKNGPSNFQLPIYYFAAKQMLGIQPSELSIFFLQAKDKNEDISYCKLVTLAVEYGKPSCSVSVDELEEVKQAILDCVSEIMRGWYPAKKGNCFNCPCKYLCIADRENDDE